MRPTWDWRSLKQILCIRSPGMGDVLMATPAIRALKKQRGDRTITLLTSTDGSRLAHYIPEIDRTLPLEVPWEKADPTTVSATALGEAVERIQELHFDGAVIMNVFSQNPLPPVLLCYLASVPNILTLARENPWSLATHWVQDHEPFDGINHEVRRQLNLVAQVGATIGNERLSLRVPEAGYQQLEAILTQKGITLENKDIAFNPGTTDAIRQYPIHLATEVARQLAARGYRVMLTGSTAERAMAEQIAREVGAGVVSLAGLLPLAAMLALIKEIPLLISNNSGPVHMAAALGTPVVDLYAQTNPQHTPWMVPHKTLYFPVPVKRQNKDPLLQYAWTRSFKKAARMPTPDQVVEAVEELKRETTTSEWETHHERNHHSYTHL